MSEGPPAASRYDVGRGRAFGWGSISGDLDPERVSLLSEHVAGASVLDVGCGGGAYVAWLALRGIRATGIDLTRELVRYAQENRPGEEFILGSALALPFKDSSFDTVLLLDVIEHLQDDRRALAEAARIARLRVIVAVPYTDPRMRSVGYLPYHWEDTTHLRNYTIESLSEAGAAAGLAPEAVFLHLPLRVSGLIRALRREFRTPIGWILHRCGRTFAKWTTRAPMTAVAGVFCVPGAAADAATRGTS